MIALVSIPDVHPFLFARTYRPAGAVFRHVHQLLGWLALLIVL